MQDDIVCENDGVKEAIRLLPKNLYNDRIIYIKRALHLTTRQQIFGKSASPSTPPPVCDLSLSLSCSLSLINIFKKLKKNAVGKIG
uniref:Cytochrome b-c1 complex subunit 7 n=1 Tax=Ailuropoda melanoleuca TaxID=9646 RepID=G1LL41_AILME